MKVYIATALENARAAERLSLQLAAVGILTTYRWWAHGSVWDTGPCDTCRAHASPPESVPDYEHCSKLEHRPARCATVAVAEARGVHDADLVIVLLPGGRGTHTEIGIAIGAGKPLILWGDLLDGHERWPAFYAHPNVIARVPAAVGLDDIALRVIAYCYGPSPAAGLSYATGPTFMLEGATWSHTAPKPTKPLRVSITLLPALPLPSRATLDADGLRDALRDCAPEVARDVDDVDAFNPRAFYPGQSVVGVVTGRRGTVRKVGALSVEVEYDDTHERYNTCRSAWRPVDGVPATIATTHAQALDALRKIRDVVEDPDEHEAALIEVDRIARDALSSKPPSAPPAPDCNGPEPKGSSVPIAIEVDEPDDVDEAPLLDDAPDCHGSGCLGVAARAAMSRVDSDVDAAARDLRAALDASPGEVNDAWLDALLTERGVRHARDAILAEADAYEYEYGGKIRDRRRAYADVSAPTPRRPGVKASARKPMGPDSFGGTDEGSHYMSQTRIEAPQPQPQPQPKADPAGPCTTFAGSSNLLACTTCGWAKRAHARPLALAALAEPQASKEQPALAPPEGYVVGAMVCGVYSKRPGRIVEVRPVEDAEWALIVEYLNGDRERVETAYYEWTVTAEPSIEVTHKG